MKKDENIEFSLLFAVSYESVDRIKDIIEKNDITNLDLNDGKDSLLTTAIKRYDSKLVEYLLKTGADPNFVPMIGIHPLILATNKEAERAVKLLIQYGANVNAKDSYGFTSLHHIAEKNLSFMIFLELLKNGADPNIKSDNGYTVLMSASGNGRDSMLQELIIKHDVDFTATNNVGENFIEIVKYGSVAHILKIHSIQEIIFNKNPELYSTFKKLNFVNPSIDIKYPHLANADFLNLL